MGSAASGALGVGFGLYNAIQGSREKRDAANALDRYQRQDLTNSYANLSPSMLGADLKREEASRGLSTGVEALQGAGSRSLIGGIGRLAAQNNSLEGQIAADLDAQQKGIDFAGAEDQSRIRGIQENREIGDLSALSSQLQAGKAQQQQGFSSIIQGAGGIAGGIGGIGGGGGASDYTTSGSGMDLTNSNMSPIDARYNPAYGMGNNALYNPSYRFGIGGNGMFANSQIPQNTY